MKYSKLFGKTLKDTPKDAVLVSHKLLYQAGFIRESTAGRYYLLPLGLRVQEKIKGIVKDEMDKAGAQEMLTPVLHPKNLWEETNRTTSVGFELMSIKDRNEMEFVLGGTAEEMLVDVVRKFQISYKDLPFNLYQFSIKFRDELRARGGLLRLREFIMKDAYSFHATEGDFKEEYKKMWDAYTKICERLGLKTVVVEADNGYIGGDYCHEFVVESPAGESKFFTTEDGSYAAHEEVAEFKYDPSAGSGQGEDEKPMEDAEGKGIIGVEELAKYLKIPVEKTTKTLLFEDEKGEILAAAVRGDFDINETKLMHAAKVYKLQLASQEVVKKVTGAEIGYAGLLNLPKNIRVFMDESMKGRKNFEMGANKTNYHSINVNFGRDLAEPERFYDIKLAKAGYTALNGQKLIEKRGIEIGNIFQLGFHYSSKMRDALFTDENGKKQPYYMGCYGFGLARTLTTIVEKYHDEKGITWPKSVAPYQAHLISIKNEASSIKDKAEEVYKKLKDAGVEVLYDDREDISAGQKFADADLIGIPVRLVISSKTEDKIEWKERTKTETELLSLNEIKDRLKQ